MGLFKPSWKEIENDFKSVDLLDNEHITFESYWEIVSLCVLLPMGSTGEEMADMILRGSVSQGHLFKWLGSKGLDGARTTLKKLIALACDCLSNVK